MIQADKKSNNETLRIVLDAAKAAKVENVSLATETS